MEEIKERDFNPSSRHMSVNSPSFFTKLRQEPIIQDFNPEDEPNH